ncbi:Uncharacterised protein [Escherichia coli]|nr:Uncharacterised protein [Escherichia coli]SQT07478.1 Uncharacterised protein [Escherichia coli]SRZ43275.1 Uncharacterised protein [Escherichia coli]
MSLRSLAKRTKVNMPVTMIYSRFATDVFTMLNVVLGK